MKRNIDTFLEDLVGDDSLLDAPEDTKAGLAVLAYLYSRQAMREEERGEMIDNLPEWLEAMEIHPTISATLTLRHLRELNILNSENRFRKGKDLDSGVLWILFAQVLNGDLECSFEGRDYRFKITPQGEKRVEEMLSNDTPPTEEGLEK